MGASLDPTLLHMPSEGSPLSPEQTRLHLHLDPLVAPRAPDWGQPNSLACPSRPSRTQPGHAHLPHLPL